MYTFKYTKELHKLSDSVYAYLQPDGSWGLSNAGVVIHGSNVLLIDTLYDLEHTLAMLNAVKKGVGNDITVDYVVNTHANGDHFYGNACVPDATIVASSAALEEMKEFLPSKMNMLMSLSWLLGDAGKYAKKAFRKFNFKAIQPVLPNKVFSGEFELDFNNIILKCIEVGPAHTKGDIIIHFPGQKIVFASDILFIDTTPVFWQGPVENLIKTCDLMTGFRPDIIVPGHGPVTNIKGVEKVKEYFTFIYEQGKKRFEKGMPVLDAAMDIKLGKFDSWYNKERIVVNIHAVYRELNPGMKPYSTIKLFGLMARYMKKMGIKG